MDGGLLVPTIKMAKEVCLQFIIEMLKQLELTNMSLSGYPSGFKTILMIAWQKGASPSKATFDFLKGTSPRMPEWRMYGHMYYEEKLKPLVKQAYKATCNECNQNCVGRTDEQKPMKPEVVYWNTIAQEMFEKETMDVKVKVAKAVEEQVNKTKVLKDRALLEGDTEIDKLQLNT